MSRKRKHLSAVPSYRAPDTDAVVAALRAENATLRTLLGRGSADLLPWLTEECPKCGDPGLHTTAWSYQRARWRPFGISVDHLVRNCQHCSATLRKKTHAQALLEGE